VEEAVSNLPVRIYGASEFKIPSPEERKTLLLAPGEGKPIPFKAVSNEPTTRSGAESITSQPWFVPALLLAGAALVTVLSRRS
jgi:hypothetical protein